MDEIQKHQNNYEHLTLIKREESLTFFSFYFILLWMNKVYMEVDCMVECKVCGKKMKWIQNTHLKQHNMTKEEYKEKFPGALLKDANMTKVLSDTRGNKTERKTCLKEGCENKVRGKHNKFCSYSCASSHRVETGENPIVKSGEENAAFIDGKSASGKTQKRKAYERDNKCCQKCKTELTEKRYGVHHIIPRRLFEDFREADKLINLVTLCGKCHKQVEADTLHLVFKLYLARNVMGIDELREYLKENLIYVSD